eukprot:799621-Pyramimonas_sp.AAC.1
MAMLHPFFRYAHASARGMEAARCIALHPATLGPCDYGCNMWLSQLSFCNQDGHSAPFVFAWRAQTGNGEVAFASQCTPSEFMPS